MGGGLLLWIAGLWVLATKDGKRFAMSIAAVSVAIMLILAYALLLPDI